MNYREWYITLETYNVGTTTLEERLQYMRYLEMEGSNIFHNLQQNGINSTIQEWNNHMKMKLYNQRLTSSFTKQYDDEDFSLSIFKNMNNKHKHNIYLFVIFYDDILKKISYQ